MTFALTPKQDEATKLLAGPARHIMLFGGSRSGKTFAILRAQAVRRIKSVSRGAVLRFRFNHLKASVIEDTWPKMMALCFPNLVEDQHWKWDRSDWFVRFWNGSQLWFGGLDDKARTEKILGQEHADIFLNECSQIPLASRNLARTRLAQLAEQADGRELALKMYYDCNPPLETHWTARMFRQKVDPELRTPLPDQQSYASLLMNPADNAANLAPGYMAELDAMPKRLRDRFRDGLFGSATDNALFSDDWFERNRVLDGSTPELVRIVVAVDPSGSGDTDNASNDEIGVVVAGLGIDGNGYLLEDLSIKGGPGTWGKVAASAYQRHLADCVVAETNFGGAMVEFTIRTQDAGIPYKAVTASRGKTVRAEPISALAELGRVRHVGQFTKLEEELAGFTTTGYIGSGSPNRADAYVWALTELFPGMVAEEDEPLKMPALHGGKVALL